MLEELMKTYNRNFEVIEVDLEDEQDIAAALEDCDSIIHSHLPDQEESQS